MVTFCKLNYTEAYTSILTYFNLTYPVTVFGSRFHKVRLSMMVLHPLLSCTCTAHSRNLFNSSSIFFFHVFLSLPGGQRPGTSTNQTLPRVSHSSLCPNHPNLLRRASSNIPTPHHLATSSQDTQSCLVTCHIPEHPSVTPNQHTLKSVRQGPHLSSIQHHRFHTTSQIPACQFPHWHAT